MSQIEYNDLLFEISAKISSNELPRMLFMCRDKLPGGGEGSIPGVLALLEELERQNHLGIDRLDTVKQMLDRMKKRSLLKKIEDFEMRRKAQSVGIVSSLKRGAGALVGAVKLVCNLRTLAGGILLVGSGLVLRSCSSFEEYCDAFSKVVLPAFSKLVELREGSLCFTVQAETVSALSKLWKMYNDKILEARLQQFLVTEEVKQLANGEDVELTVFIDDQEYKDAYVGLMLQHNQDATEEEEPDEKRRRNSDSFLFLSPKRDEVTMMKLKLAENKLELEREKIKATEREIMTLKFEIGKLEEDEGPVERRRRTSDSFLFLSPKRDELAQMKLQLAENKLELEKEKRKAVEWENMQLRLETGKLEVREREDVERLRERHRRNSDSELYCEAKDKEIREKEKKHLFLQDDKYAFVRRYIENVVETQSITTETSDSGVKTHGTPPESVGGTEHILATDEAQRLCVKHLRPEFANELKRKIDADTVTARHICQSFGITGEVTADAMFKSFSDIPLYLLRDVFEALELLDLVELLDKEMKPSTSRSLRSFVTLNEIRKLTNTDSRPVTFHSKAAVLIVTTEEQDPIDIEAVQFFKDLNLDSTVSISMHPDYKTQQMIKPMITEEMEKNIWSIRELMYQVNEHKQRGIPETDFMVRRLTEQLESGRQKLKRLEKDLKEIENTEEHARATASVVIDKWIQCQDDFSLFAVFDLGPFDFFHDLIVKLAREIPNKPKLIITSWTDDAEVLPETLLVTAKIHIRLLIETLLVIPKRRWQTLNLASMMREFKRTAKTTSPLYFWFNKLKRDKWDITIKDTLSSLVRLKREEGLG